MTEVSPAPQLAPLKGVPKPKESVRTEDGYNMTLLARGNALDALPTVASPRLPLLNSMSVGPPAYIYTRYQGIPRRYEETKPVAVQNFTHRKILDIGYDIHQRSQNKADQEKEQAIEEAEKRLWEYAEKIKFDALERLEEKLQEEREKFIKKLKKEHEKAIKEEALRVESVMQQLAIEQVKQEREEGEKRLEAAVKQTEKRCHQELLTAVAAARKEEKAMAAKEAARKEKEFNAKFSQMVEDARIEKERALVELAEEKDWQRQEAVTRTRQHEQEVAAHQLKEVSREFEGRIKVLKYQLGEKQREIYSIEDILRQIENMKDLAEQELYETRFSFQKYIDQFNNVIPGHADYQMPPSKVNFQPFLLRMEAAAAACQAAEAAENELATEDSEL